MKIHAQINRLVDKPDSQVRAFASVSLDGMFAVHGIRVIENDSGRFAAMPSNAYVDRNGDTKYSDIFHAITKDAHDAIARAVLSAYEQKIAQTQAGTVEVMPGQNNAQGVEVPEDADEEPDISL